MGRARVNRWFNSPVHPGWPSAVGPLRVPAGVVRATSHPVKGDDALEPHPPRRTRSSRALEPTADPGLVRAPCRSAPLALHSGLRSEARKGRMLPYVDEVDGRFAGQLDHRSPRTAV